MCLKSKAQNIKVVIKFFLCGNKFVSEPILAMWKIYSCSKHVSSTFLLCTNAQHIRCQFVHLRFQSEPKISFFFLLNLSLGWGSWSALGVLVITLISESQSFLPFTKNADLLQKVIRFPICPWLYYFLLLLLFVSRSLNNLQTHPLLSWHSTPFVYCSPKIFDI